MTEKDNIKPVEIIAYKCPICNGLYETIPVAELCIKRCLNEMEQHFLLQL